MLALTLVGAVWAVALLSVVALCASAADGDAGGWRMPREHRLLRAMRDADAAPAGGTWRPAA